MEQRAADRVALTRAPGSSVQNEAASDLTYESRCFACLRLTKQKQRSGRLPRGVARRTHRNGRSEAQVRRHEGARVPPHAVRECSEGKARALQVCRVPTGDDRRQGAARVGREHGHAGRARPQSDTLAGQGCCRAAPSTQGRGQEDKAGQCQESSVVLIHSLGAETQVGCRFSP